MRASAKVVTGNVGETEVTAKFERLGWGVAPNPRHDVGTDLWLSARDERLFDLGLLVGAQVKGGPSWFKKPCRDGSGALVGWWFTDNDREHIDAWLAHAVPHLVVLHDLATDTSYWAHVTPDAVTGTGRGAKLLVPAANRVDEAHRDALLRVAASKRTGGAWEGSAWTGAAAVPPSALLRHALIVPRLIAPHPNIGHSHQVNAFQAVALLVQARLADLRSQCERHDSMPSLEDAGDSDDWNWRFFGALGRRVTTGEHQALAQRVSDAPDAARRAAAAVAAAATLLEDSLAADALTILDAALEDDQTGPADQAWLEIQKARACAELGRIDEARDLAARAQSVGATLADDVTATALAGVAALLLFNTSDWQTSDVAAVIAGADTTAAWWRTQTVSRGLTALTERTFWGWSRDTTTRLTAGDPANDQLLSAALTANFAGDHGTWRHLSGLLAVDRLLRLDRGSSPDEAADGLRTLLMAGAADEMKHALRRLADDGPAQAITAIGAELNLDRTTRTTAPVALTLLERGGDLLDQASADEAVRWLLATIDDPDAFVDRTRPTYLLPERLVDTLAGVAAAAGLDVQRQVAERVSALPPQSDQSRATSWARAAAALPPEAWARGTAVRAGTAARGHHKALATPLLAAAAAHDPAVRERLLEDALGGDLDALGALGDVTVLPQDVIVALTRSLAGLCRAQVSQAEAGMSSFGGHDVGHALALLNVWHPELAQWSPLIDLIAHPLVVPAHKRATLGFLAGTADRVTEQVREELLAAVRVAASEPVKPFVGLLRENRDNGGPASELIASLTQGHDPDAIPALLAGDEDSRASAARVARRLRRPEDIGALLVLAVDLHPAVRSAAALGLAELTATGQGGEVVLSAVRRAAQDPGRRVPEAVAAALSVEPALPPGAQDVLDLLATHRSARVRRAARRLGGP